MYQRAPRRLGHRLADDGTNVTAPCEHVLAFDNSRLPAKVERTDGKWPRRMARVCKARSNGNSTLLAGETECYYIIKSISRIGLKQDGNNILASNKSSNVIGLAGSKIREEFISRLRERIRLIGKILQQEKEKLLERATRKRNFDLCVRPAYSSSS